jgi:hypothetical protein
MRVLSAPEPLGDSHDVSGFDCGTPEINDWLQNRARTSEGKHARTYVACEGNAVVGYYCISAGSVQRQVLPSKLKREQGQPNETPVVVLGRLGRDVRYRGTGLGADLLMDAVTRIITASEIVGMRCILVQAIDEGAMAFYRRWSDRFTESPIGSRTLYLPIETAIAAVAARRSAGAAGA